MPSPFRKGILCLSALLLAACGSLPAPGGLGSPTPSLHPAATSAPGDLVPQAGGTEGSETLYQNETFKISLRHPASWGRLEGDPASGEKIGGPDGYFIISGIAGGGMDLDEQARAEAGHDLQPFGSNPTIEPVLIQGMDARLVLPSADQPRLTPDEPAWGLLLAPYPRPVLVNQSLADVLALYADLNHLRALAASLSFAEQPDLFPPDSDTPAAGICDPAQGNPVTLAITLDVPSPRCIKVQPDQVLAIRNQAGGPVVFRLAWYEVSLEDGEETLFNVPAGTYLAPGVHQLELGGSGNSPEIWLLP